MTDSPERILFLTGRLAEHSVRSVVRTLSQSRGFEYEIEVVGVSVAALMHTGLIARRVSIEGRGFDRAIVPGWCQGDLDELGRQFKIPFERGPKDLFDLPEYFGMQARGEPDLDFYDIEIIAEINHAPQLTDRQIVSMATNYRASGANIIDIGCIPGNSWSRAGEVTQLLRREGFRISIDSFDQAEVESAVAAGAELVLSCRSENVGWLTDLPVEVVVIPDDPHVIGSLQQTIDQLEDTGTSYRIDPILEPIGFGFAASLQRYFDVRRQWPDAQMMMGIGNLTELTDVDTSGVNFLLAAICQELEIHSVLTTEVINWARSAVAEFDVSRRMVRHALTEHVLPKNLDSRLIMLRDPRVHSLAASELTEMSTQIGDANFRVFAAAGEIHLMNRDGYWHGQDPFEVFERAVAGIEPLEQSHAFYLGYEFSKAVTALTLGKQYTQDQPLKWGMLTRPEISAHDRRRCDQLREQPDDGPSE
jgi:dihydropteroate synthase-like protein